MAAPGDIFDFYKRLDTSATFIRNGSIIDDTSDNFDDYIQIGIYFRESQAPEFFYNVSAEDWKFKFDISGVVLDLSNLTSNVINSKDSSGNYYLTNDYAFHSFYDPDIELIQQISNLKSRVEDEDFYLGQMYGSNSAAINDIATFTNYQYLDVFANSFPSILSVVNTSALLYFRQNIFDRLTVANKMDASGLNLSDGDAIRFGIVFNISQQVNNTVFGLNPSGDGNFYINFEGSQYVIPQFDICSALITQCYALNFIQTANV
jgi:hypothetical protein